MEQMIEGGDDPPVSLRHNSLVRVREWSEEHIQ